MTGDSIKRFLKFIQTRFMLESQRQQWQKEAEDKARFCAYHNIPFTPHNEYGGYDRMKNIYETTKAHSSFSNSGYTIPEYKPSNPIFYPEYNSTVERERGWHEYLKNSQIETFPDLSSLETAEEQIESERIRKIQKQVEAEEPFFDYRTSVSQEEKLKRWNKDFRNLVTITILIIVLSIVFGSELYNLILKLLRPYIGSF